MSFNNKTIEELHDLLVSKEISATELTQATLDDIKAREEAVNAFVTVAEEAALAQAKAIDEKGIDADNLLSGIPLAVKDNISTDGILTTAASKMLYNYEPIFDATAVANAKAKDMIVIGKTNMDEFAMGGSGETSYYGATKNAWDHSKVPGGSSSGSAASVASGQVRLSLGSDTGGSIRQPAAFNGIVGLKPTYGTVSSFGLIAFGSSLDQIGTFSPTVKENAQLLNIIASEDAKDSTSAPVRVADFTSKIGQDIMKIALPKEYLGEGIDPEVKETILNAAKHFEKLGALHVGIALAAHGHKGHRRHAHQFRRAFRQVELLVFLLEIERHGSSFRCKGALADSAMLPQAAGRILAKGVRLRRASHLRVSFASTFSDDRGGGLGDRLAPPLPSAQSATAPCQLAVRKASSASPLLRWSET